MTVAEEQKLKFDKTISAGHVLTFASMVVGLFVAVGSSALLIGSEDARLHAEELARVRAIQGVEHEIEEERLFQRERMTAVDHRLDQDIEAERAAIAQLQQTLAQISARLDQALEGRAFPSH